MARITWLGSEDYREGETPLEAITWNGVLFTAGDRVEVTDEWMIKKAKGNKFFLVEDAAPLGPAKPEMWTNDPPPDVSFFDDPPGVDERYPDNPPDYPPEDEPDREPKKRRGRPPRIRENSNGDQ